MGDIVRCGIRREKSTEEKILRRDNEVASEPGDQWRALLLSQQGPNWGSGSQFEEEEMMMSWNYKV